jgi:hypothetical protein
MAEESPANIKGSHLYKIYKVHNNWTQWTISQASMEFQFSDLDTVSPSIMLRVRQSVIPVIKLLVLLNLDIPGYQLLLFLPSMLHHAPSLSKHVMAGFQDWLRLNPLSLLTISGCNHSSTTSFTAESMEPVMSLKLIWWSLLMLCAQAPPSCEPVPVASQSEA